MEMNSSMLGWRAVCDGTRTGGLWSLAECQHHINYLEMLATTQGIYEEQEELSRPPENGQQSCCVLCELHGWNSLPNKLAIQLLQWCLVKNLSLLVVQLLEISNCVADKELRMIQSSAEWHLDQKIFYQIVKVLGDCNVDLFASQLNTQLEQYVSCIPTILLYWQMPRSLVLIAPV